MNFARLVLAIVTAFVADAVYGLLVYGTLLGDHFRQFPNVYRPDEAQLTFMPVLFGGLLLAMIAACVMYAKGTKRDAAQARGSVLAC